MTDATDWPVFSARLDRALALDPAEREGWLATLADEHPEHAARLRTLLDAAPDMERARFLAGPAVARGESASLLGARIGPYVIEAEIGRGGMSSVWRARRDDGRFDGFAAIKFVSFAAMGANGEARFRREGLLLGRLDHPNIARLLDAGIYGATRQPYLVLEYVAGAPIDMHCEHAQLDARARVALFVAALEAVAHAHGHLVVHRDLKPSNILVTQGGTVKLLDFGIAKLLESDEAATRTGELALTPEYAAPEQVLGGAITIQTDVYALGLVLHRLLTGQHAIALDGRSRTDLVRAVVEAEPPRPSAVAPGLARLRADLPGDLDNIVAKALRKAPGERYATALAMADDLVRYLRFEPVTARPDTLSYRAAKFVRRNRGGVLAAALVSIALIAAAGITTWQLFEARRQRDIAQREVARAKAQVELMDQVLTQLAERGERLTPELLLDRSVEFVEKRFASKPEFAVGFLIHLSGRYMNLGNTQKELAALVKAERIAERSGDPVLLARAECNTVETELAAGRPERARARFERGRQALARSGSSDAVVRFDCASAASKVLDAEGDLDGAIAAGTEAAEILEASDQFLTLPFYSVSSLLAMLHAENLELSEAMRWNRACIESLERGGRSRTEQMAGARANRSQILGAAGEWRAALALQRETLESFYPDAPDSALHPFDLSWIGTGLLETGDAAASLPWFRRAETRAQETGSETHLLRAQADEARAQLALGNLEQARRAVAAVALHTALGTELHRATLVSAQLTSAETALAAGDAAAADRAFAALLAKLGYPETRKARGLVRALEGRSASALAAGSAASATRWAEEARAAATAIALDPEQSADVGDAWLALARAQAAAGNTRTARRAAAHAARVLSAGRGANHPSTRAARSLAAPAKPATPPPTP